MAKALTVELFLGVLAVVALEGCRAASEKASPEPAPAAASATTAATTTAAPANEAPPPPAEPALTAATTTATPAPVTTATVTGKAKAAAVDAGIEVKRDKDGPARSAPQAACGAGGCSAEMKKGTK